MVVRRLQMSLSDRFKKYLNNSNINYSVISHNPTYTAEELANELQVPEKDLAKTVIVKSDDGYAMIVLPASRKINLDYLKNAMGKKDIELADEAEFVNLFPDCELGAMPPFGNLYKIPVYVALRLSEDDEIIFNAGTHSDAIKMSFKDFKRLVDPRIAYFSEPLH